MEIEVGQRYIAGCKIYSVIDKGFYIEKNVVFTIHSIHNSTNPPTCTVTVNHGVCISVASANIKNYATLIEEEEETFERIYIGLKSNNTIVAISSLDQDFKECKQMLDTHNSREIAEAALENRYCHKNFKMIIAIDPTDKGGAGNAGDIWWPEHENDKLAEALIKKLYHNSPDPRELKDLAGHSNAVRAALRQISVKDFIETN